MVGRFISNLFFNFKNTKSIQELLGNFLVALPFFLSAIVCMEVIWDLWYISEIVNLDGLAMDKRLLKTGKAQTSLFLPDEVMLKLMGISLFLLMLVKKLSKPQLSLFYH